ncbi:transglutaminase domain-containing protein [Azonexus sp.]|uniref:transglutaminase domain-containing protein n=1 Tax=Azonexus sp. TaxID=1872668 RepID=UPI0039E401EB
MKRRDFLTAAAALLSLEALAAPQKKNQKSTSKNTKSTGKKPAAGKSKKTRGSPAKKTSTRPAAYTAPPSADNSVIDNPPAGSSATRLPPVRAAEAPLQWKSFEIVTTLSLKANAPCRLWLPLPLDQDALYQRVQSHQWQSNSPNLMLSRLPDGQLEVLYSEWTGKEDIQFRMTSRVSTADRHFDITRRSMAPEREDILRRALQASDKIPNDGAVRQLGERIIGRVKDPVAQAKEIYDWIGENCRYDASLPGCGSGDIQQQLGNARYGGRSADINGLFVALCRSIGIPARTVPGLRIGPSRLLQSLGIDNQDATHAQHVRAEFYVPGYAWIPVDPSDVCRAIARSHLSNQDSRLSALKRVLFGVWEMNWIAFNHGSDLQLPGESTPQAFFAHPRVLLNQQAVDSLNPLNTPYTITARSI